MTALRFVGTRELPTRTAPVGGDARSSLGSLFGIKPRSMGMKGGLFLLLAK
jgi:hypothetical protein